MSNQQLDQYNMDALTANQWHLECEFAPENQKRAFLSSLVEQVIQSWVTDPSNRDYLAPYDDSNLRDDIDLTESSTGIVRSFLGGNAHSKNTGLSNQVTVIKSERVEDVVNFVFHPVSRRPRQDKLPDVIQTQQGISLSSTKKLINRFKSAVPYRSFLWNLLFYSLESISNGKGNQSKHTLIGFLKVVWEETVRQIRWHWENLVPLPDLDPFLYNSSNDKTMGVDLRYNIVS